MEATRTYRSATPHRLLVERTKNEQQNNAPRHKKEKKNDGAGGYLGPVKRRAFERCRTTDDVCQVAVAIRIRA